VRALNSLAAVAHGRAPQNAGDGGSDASSIPYPSLKAFRPEQADLFFGRTAETEQLLAQVMDSPFTAVVGASGSGKSSLVMAGLLPKLDDGWLTCSMMPGRWPLTTLAGTLARAIPGSDLTMATKALETDLERSPDELAKAARRILVAQDRGNERKLLVVIDQFEEIFTYAMTPGGLTFGGREFIANLARAAETGEEALRIVITVRVDFLRSCIEYADLVNLLQNRQLLLGPLDEASLREAIAQPAQVRGGFFERGLVARLVEDMRDRSGALPLLQTALAELWRRRDGLWMSHAAYDAIDGIGGVLNQLADQLYAGLTARQQELTRATFLRLVAVGDGVAPTYTRRRIPRTELDIVDADPAEINLLIRRLSQADTRLISVDADTVELTHEALIERWELLRSWLRQNEADLRLHRQLTQDAKDWDGHQRETSYLYRGSRLAVLGRWVERNRGDLNRLEEAFLLACQAQEEQVQARERADLARARAGQAIFELDISPETALLLAAGAAIADVHDTPDVQRVVIRAMLSSKIQRILRGHKDRISSVAWHWGTEDPGQDVVATGSYDGTVRLWDVATGAVLAVLAGHTDCVTCVAFDRAGLRLVSGSWDNTAKIWNLDSKSEIQTLTGHSSWVSSVTWSPSERYIATGGQDHTARIWSVADATTICTLQGHQEWVRSVEWHPQEHQVLTGSYDGTAGLWKVPSGKRIAVLQGHTDAVPAVAWSRDGSQALTASEDGTVRLWDMSKRVTVRTIEVHTSPTYCVSWSPTGDDIVTGSEDGKVRLFSLETGELREAWPGHTGWVSSVAWSPDGARIISGSEDATARVWTLAPEPRGLAVGRQDGWVSDLTWHPDGLRFASAGQDGVARLWNLNEPGAVIELDGAQTLSLAWSPSGRILACGGSNGEMRIWDAGEWSTIVAGTAHQDQIRTLAWNSTETRLATASYDGTVIIWDAATWEPIAQFADTSAWISDVAWSPDGESVLIAPFYRNEGIIWNVTTNERRLLTGHSAALHSCDWRGDRLLTSSGDGTVRLWSPDSGDQTHLLPAGEAHAAFLNPTGDLVISGSRDGGVRLWKISETADLVTTFQHPGSIYAVAWRPTGEEVLTGCADGLIRLWPASPSQMFSNLRGRVESLFSLEQIQDRVPEWPADPAAASDPPPP
jgi:WD40 repeat protein